MSATAKGPLWRLVQSWYILLTFTLFFNWLAFFYIGFRAKQKKWGIWGIIYSIPFILMVIFSESTDAQSTLWGFIVLLILIGNIASIIHGFRVRKEYLLRLEAIQLKKKTNEIYLRKAIESEYGVDLKSTNQSKVNKEKQVKLDSGLEKQQEKQHIQIEPEKRTVEVGTYQAQQETTKVLNQNQSTSNVKNESVEETRLIDLNIATEQQIAALPGVGVILAKKAIQYRESRGGFLSLEEFGQVLALKPHVVEKLRPLVVFSQVERKSSGEVSGRLVDF